MPVAGLLTAPHTELLRLDWRDASEIGSLVNRVWEKSYGSPAHPRFGTPYLEWLYGGPGAAENLLLGIRRGGQLVGFKALLSRRLIYRGRRLRAHLGTHLTVDTELDLRDRVEAITTLTRPHSFLAAEHPGWTHRVDVYYAFYDETKTILRNTYRVMDGFGLTRSASTFQQSVVNPVALEAAARAEPSRPLTRRATRADERDIRAIFDAGAPRQPFAIAMPGELLGHHLFGPPHSRVYLAGGGSDPAGLIAFLPMETVSFGRVSRVVVVEFLLVEARAAAIALLMEALAFSRQLKAKGVVIENATCLSPALQRECGVLPSARRMTMAAFARDPMPIDGGFLADVK